MKRMALAAVFAVSTVAFGQVQQPAPQVDDHVRDAHFGERNVQGELRGPEGEYHLARPREQFGSLIKVRTSFNDSLQKSTDSLR